MRTAQEDQRLYGFTPATDSVLIKLNKGYASPSMIAPGQQTTIYSDYSLSLPPSYNNQADVTYQAIFMAKAPTAAIVYSHADKAGH